MKDSGGGQQGASEAELDRWPAVQVAALLALPESNARSFMVAFALGSILDDRGTTRSLGVGSSSAGSLITKKKAAHIRQVLGIEKRQWRALVADWTARYLAHRCSPGVVVLFRKPLLEYCPWASCGEFVEGPGKGPTPAIEAKPRGRSFESGTDAAAETALLVPPSGADAAARAAQMLPFLSRNPADHKQGLLPRDEEGLQEEVSSTHSSEGFTETRRDAEIEEGLA